MKRRSFIATATTAFAALCIPKSVLSYFSRAKIKTPTTDVLDPRFTGVIKGIGVVTESRPPWSYHRRSKIHEKDPTTICQTCGDFCIIENCPDCEREWSSEGKWVSICGKCIAICINCGHKHEGQRDQLETMTKPRRFLDLYQTFHYHLERNFDGKVKRFEEPWHLKLYRGEEPLYNMMDVIRTSDGMMVKCR